MNMLVTIIKRMTTRWTIISISTTFNVRSRYQGTTTQFNKPRTQKTPISSHQLYRQKRTRTLGEYWVKTRYILSLYITYFAVPILILFQLPFLGFSGIATSGHKERAIAKWSARSGQQPISKQTRNHTGFNDCSRRPELIGHNDRDYGKKHEQITGK